MNPQAIQDVVCFFFWTDLEKFSITSLAHQWILFTGMGAVRMRVQTADKNITVITSNSSTSINILWSEKLCVCNKQIHQDIFNLKPLLLLESSIYNFAFSETDKLVD